MESVFCPEYLLLDVFDGGALSVEWSELHRVASCCSTHFFSRSLSAFSTLAKFRFTASTERVAVTEGEISNAVPVHS